ncbi:serine hydrolase domain-containing protein [Phenylobacterium sp.]|jgi:CubicO group peptidase (beta-lactamase class C family)|uniref:serine hydrolase domain-containing protein n=1 Tax=Phenylobacterium sp. TaxID=1871053 RepID=UPI002E2FAFE6|nr:serine hydrolase domain-containing protein [Phenylobacterium sp.]HEX2560524.1 serine hydrolase domain-containing protein [Phenylobacterium sp.]
MRPLVKAVFTALFAVLSIAPPAPAQPLPEAAGPAPAPSAPVASAPVPNPPAPKLRPPRPAARPAAAPAAGPAPAGPGAGLAPAAAAPTLPSGARLAPGQPIAPAELEAFVDGVVKQAMARDHIAGVTVSVVQNGQIAMKKGYGYADLAKGRRVDPDQTLFRIGSISKTFTWIALMQEVEAGRIRLDAPVNLYLPQRLQVPDQGFENEVLVRHLMDHSAGFEDRALGHLFEQRPGRERPLATYLQQERPSRVAEPGARSSYSNYAVGLAGAAASHVSQTPFERLIEARITGPLALTRTTFREPRPTLQGLPAPMPAALAQHVSQPYRWTPTGFAPREFEYIGHVAPAGSASSTAADMARYMQMILNGGTLDGAVIYSPRTAQLFQTPLRRTPAGINGWTHGFIQYALPGGITGYGHDGATLSFMSNMTLAPQLGLGIFVSANTETGGRLVQDLADQVVQQFYVAPAPPPRPGVPALAEQAERFDGYYLASRRAHGGLEGFVMLFQSGAQVRVTQDGRLMLAAPGLDAARLFVPEGDPAAGRFVSVTGEDRLQFAFQDSRAASLQTSSNGALLERAGLMKQPQVLALLALLTALAAIATLGGIMRRMQREHRESTVQGRASLIQNTQALLWLAALALFGVWATQASDIANVVYNWPGATLIIASACALFAAVLTAVTVVLLPIIWQGGRRVDSWSPGRKLAFTLTTLIYAAFSAVLFNWGALSPWG